LAKPGARDELIKALTKLVEPTRLEPGCLQYELLADTENTHFFIMLEKFADQKALELHEEQPYIKHFVENEMNLLCEQVSWNVAKQIDN
jgi:quinol monooxygenase YgiN